LAEYSAPAEVGGGASPEYMSEALPLEQSTPHDRQKKKNSDYFPNSTNQLAFVMEMQ